MQFAIEMLPAGADPKLVSALRRDVEETDRLIARFIEIGRGFSNESPEPVEIGGVLADLIEDVSRIGGRCE